MILNICCDRMRSTMPKKWLSHMITFAVILALLVVMLGAYTRLTNAGLGCPDWPGCYGQMVLPKGGTALQSAQQQFPLIPLETGKAWTEMIHRYAAGTLALLIFIIGAGLIRRGSSQIKLPVILIVLVFFQSMLGMWTVTLKLLPIVVMAHLIGGMLIFAGLCQLRLRVSSVRPVLLPTLRPWVLIGVLLVILQIALGGWVSSNYAGIACIGFPRCNGQWLPALDFSQGFHLFSTPGLNYQGGLLDNEARVTIQFIHRIGAVLTASYTLILALVLMKKPKPINRLAAAALLLIILQFMLGILNVVFLLPLWTSVAHNGVAGLLLATWMSLLYLTQGREHVV